MSCMADGKHAAHTGHCQMIASRWTVTVGWWCMSIAPALAAWQGPRAKRQHLPQYW